MLLDDIEFKDDIIVVTIPHTKNGSSRKFVITEPLWVNIVKNYLAIRKPVGIARAFISFRNGKPSKQVIGHNTISGVPKMVATFLKLPNVKSYTGHSIRRTSATILAENGGDILTLKRHGGWKSSAVAEGYIEQSITDKIRIADMVQGPSTSKSSCSELNLAKNETFRPCDDTARAADDLLEREIVDATKSNDNIPRSFKSTEINIPVENNQRSFNAGKAVINMNCQNCTINYNFK